MKQAYPWLGTWSNGVLETRHNQEDTPMQEDSGSWRNRPDRMVPRVPLDEVVRQGAQRLVQRAVEIEVDLFLERVPVSAR